MKLVEPNMTVVERYHRSLKHVGIGIALVNLGSCFTLDLREWLVYFDPFIIWLVVLPGFIIVLPSLPFLVTLERTPRPSLNNTLWLAAVTVLLGAFEALWFAMIAVAMFFRGPNWNFYWPWEERIPKVVPLNKVNLSDYFWIRFLDNPLPMNPLWRESPGIILVVVHVLVVPLLACVVLRRLSSHVPAWRLWLFAVIVQVLAALPIKMFLRWFMNLKYIVAFPEWFLNL
jgi:hypothetical protein